MFVLGKPFQPSIMFVSKAGAYPSVRLFGFSTLGQVPRNIGLDWKGLPGSNTLAYYKHS
jgi:hypothetical protein